MLPARLTAVKLLPSPGRALVTISKLVKPGSALGGAKALRRICRCTRRNSSETRLRVRDQSTMPARSSATASIAPGPGGSSAPRNMVGVCRNARPRREHRPVQHVDPVSDLARQPPRGRVGNAVHVSADAPRRPGIGGRRAIRPQQVRRRFFQRAGLQQPLGDAFNQVGFWIVPFRSMPTNGGCGRASRHRCRPTARRRRRNRATIVSR